MKRTQQGAGASVTQFSLADFASAGRGELKLSVAAGRENLDRKVLEPIASRAGLALTGFYEHFPWKRLQLVGNAESAYLASLPGEVRLERFRALLDRKAYCFVFTNGQKPTADEVALAERAGAVIFTSLLKTRTFTLRSTFVMDRLSAPRTSIYGTMVEVGGLGVMFEGDPGLGKSETALGLIKRGCALVADDLTCVRRETGGDILFGSASASTAGYMEIRGIGIMHIPSIFGINAVRGEKRLQLVVTFKRLRDVKDEIDRVGQTRKVRTILGVDVPNVIIPVSEGRDLVNLVETAVQQQKFLMSGRDPVEELSQHLKRRADMAKSGAVPAKGRSK